MSPDKFLQAHGLRYDEQAGFGTTNPAEIVALLKTLNGTRFVDEHGQIVYIVYQTPGYHSTPALTPPPNELVQRQQKAHQEYLVALKTGNVTTVHTAVDSLNAVKMELGGQPGLIPPSDFEIVAHGDNPEGFAARNIQTLAQALDELDIEGADWNAIFANGGGNLPAHSVQHPIVNSFGPVRDISGAVVGIWESPDFYRALEAYVI